MTPENLELFEEIIEDCHEYFGSEFIGGKKITLLEAFKDGFVDDFAGSKEEKLEILSLLLTIENCLSGDKVNEDLALSIARDIHEKMYPGSTLSS